MKISVVIPAYNAEQTIGRTLDSVLAQTRAADEIIVVDDGSADASADVIRSYGDKVRLIQQENAGVSVARNAGIEAAAGDWIAFLDGDDEWLPDKLKLQAEHLQRHPDLRWTYGNFYNQDQRESSDQTPAHVSPELMSLLAGGERLDDYLQAFVNYGYAWTGTIMVRRDVFQTVGMFKPGMKIAQDTDLWFRIAYLYPKIGYLSQPLSIYHLDTPGSSMKINYTVDFMIDFVCRHEQLSKQSNRWDALAACITSMVQTWTRRLVRQHRRKEAALLLRTFSDYLPKRFQLEMRFRIRIPVVGSMITDLYFQLKRKW